MFLLHIHLSYQESSPRLLLPLSLSLFLSERLPPRIHITGSSRARVCPPNCETPSSVPRRHHHFSIRQTAAGSLTDSWLISHKLVLPLAHFFLFVSGSSSFHSPHAPFSRLQSLPGPHISFFFLQNATQQSLKKCHSCLLLLFCNFSVSLLFSWEFIYGALSSCPRLSRICLSVFAPLSVSLSLSPLHSIPLCCACLCTSACTWSVASGSLTC